MHLDCEEKKEAMGILPTVRQNERWGDNGFNGVKGRDDVWPPTEERPFFGPNLDEDGNEILIPWGVQAPKSTWKAAGYNKYGPGRDPRVADYDLVRMSDAEARSFGRRFAMQERSPQWRVKEVEWKVPQ